MLNKFLRNSRNLLILGAILAILAFGLAFSLLSRAASSPTLSANNAVPTPPPAPALVARVDVPAFAQITDSASAVRQYFTQVPYNKAGYLPPDYVKGQTGLDAILVGGPHHLAIKLAQGQPLLASELLTSTAPGTIDYAPLLAKGEVAESLQVQPVAAANASIQPGDHVDLLLSLKLSLTKAQAAKHAFYTDNGTALGPGVQSWAVVGTTYETQSTLQNVRVLSAAGTNYLVAMKAQDAVLLKWIKDSSGTVDLVVRASDDSGSKPIYYPTTPVLSDYLKDKIRNKFVLP